MRSRFSFAKKLITLLVLFAILYSYAMFQGGFVSWFLFYSFLPLLIYMLFLLFYPLAKWSVERKISQSIVEAGEKVEVKIEINRRFRFPIYYCIVEEFFPSTLQEMDKGKEKYLTMDKIDASSEKRMVKKVTFPWFKKRITYTYSLDHLPRGNHHFHAIRVRTGDFLGFIKKDYVYEVESKLLVFPARRHTSMKERVSSFEEGAQPSYNVHLKNTNVVTGVREYYPGDRFSWIDWKTTARKNSVMTKEFEQEKSDSTVIAFDAVHHEQLNKLAFEGSVELAYSIVNGFNKNTTDLSFLSVGEKSVLFKVGQDPGKKELANRHLAQVQPSGEISFAQRVLEETKKVSQGLIVMLVTTNLSAPMKNSIRQLNQKSKRVVLFLVKPSSELTDFDHQTLKQMKVEGIVVNLISEKELINEKIEVNV